MSEPVLCSTCKNPLPVNAPLGLCPVCLLRGGMDADSLSVAHPGDVGVTANWNEELAHQSVLDSLTASIGEVPRVLLRETGDEDQRAESGSSSSDPPYDTIGRYRIESSIGKGGMGEVLRGRDSELGREIAVKVLLEKHRAHPDLARRFLEEAQIAGQLVHPGIVPVYEMGTSADHRPFFTMKLVRGPRLAELLSARETTDSDLPRFLSIFEQVCQAVAYAHSRGVIHRDLKPQNMMVGAFGEVQVMDWGLAKVLARSGREQTSDSADETDVRIVRNQAEPSATRVGSVFGTPQYMPPEQARGEIDKLDERADVFALGAILCEILTGQPPFAGASGIEVLARAARADLADAFARLDGCGADSELTKLATQCLSADPLARPREAGELARRMTAYSAGVQERLRSTELARAAELARAEEAIATAAAAERARAAEAARADEEKKGRELADQLAREANARAAAERNRRRVTVGLAASVLALAGLAGGTWLVSERSRIQRHVSVASTLDEARRLLAVARSAESDAPARWADALAALERADGLLAQGGEASQKRQADELRRGLEAARNAAATETEWVARLIDIRTSKADDSTGQAAESRYAAVFHEAGIDPDVSSAAEAGAKIRTFRPVVAQAMVAALDDWAAIRHHQRLDLSGALRLSAVARAADPDEWRDRLRASLEQPVGKDRLAALKLLASTARVDELPAVSLHLLGVALSEEGDRDVVESLLRQAQRRHPRDAWLKFHLAETLQNLGRTEEAIQYYMAARMIVPESAHELAHLLKDRGETDEAIAVFQDLRRLRHDNPRDLVCLTGALLERGLKKEADAVCDAAIAILESAISKNQGDSYFHMLIGMLLRERAQLDQAIAEYRTAIRLMPDYAEAHDNLGLTLADQGKLDDAIAEYRKAIRLKPDLANAHNNLGLALTGQGKLDDAIVEYRKAIRLNPAGPMAYCNLGALFCDKLMNYSAAEGEFRTALRLKPDYAEAHNNLGAALKNQGKLDEAIAEYREAIRLKLDYALAHNNLGYAL